MKNIYRLALLLFFIGLASLGSAQEMTQTIRGIISDKDTREPLIGAALQVFIEGKSLGVVADAQGKFKLSNVPLGRASIKVSYVGYETRTLSDILVHSAKEVILNIELTEKIERIDYVIIKANKDKSRANNDLILVSGRSFTVDQANRYAGGFNDPSRMAANFAGVAGGGNDQRNDIVIRGNSPMGLLWRLEGADIPNPNHFGSQGANGGPVSIVNTNMLANSDFLTGAFPAEYGNANAGVFDLKLRNGNNEKREFIGQVGFAGLELLAEGPIQKSKGSSYMLSYRYSTLSLFEALGIQFGNSGIPKYQDVSFKFNFPETKLGAISFFGIGGKSSTQLLDSKKTEAERATMSNAQDVDFGSAMGVIGFTHTLRMGSKAYFKTIISASGESNVVRVDTLSNSNVPFYLLGRTTNNTRQSVHSFYNHKINAKHSFKLGLIGSRIGGAMYDSLWVNSLQSYFPRLDFSEHSYLVQTYVNYNYRFTARLNFNGGLHLNYLQLNQSYSLDPRASIRYQLRANHALAFGYGKHSQTQPLLTYFTKTLVDTFNQVYANTNNNLKMSEAHHFVLTYDWLLTENTRIKVETYYQFLNQLPVTQNPSYFSTVNFGADFVPIYADSLVNAGRGYNYGLEITLERFFNKGFYYLFTGSFYESKYRGSDLIWRNTAFNGNFVVNALVGKEWKVSKAKNNVFGLNLKVVYSGGRRFIPVDELASQQKGDVVYKELEAYTNRLPAFFRTDFKISYRQNAKKYTQEFALEIQNIFNTQNVLNQIWNPATGSLQTNYQIGFFPVPFYRIYF
ncbi:MAG: TonB-dependent receptor [Bacteroidia bacterium]